MKNPVRVTGSVRLDVHDARTGELLRSQDFHNLLAVGGADLISNALAGVASKTITYIAYGTGNTIPARTDVVLDTEVFRDVFTVVDTTTVVGELSISHYLDVSSGNGNTLSEIAIFGGVASATADSGTLFSRALLADPIVKTADITVTTTWVFTWEGR